MRTLGKDLARRVIGLLLCMITAIGSASAKPSIEKSWLVCEENADCITLQGGCYYWQPVNKKYTDAMKAAIFIACKKSLGVPPQPTSSCVNHMCVNDPYAVKQWKYLVADNDYQGLRYVWVGEWINECFQPAAMKVNDSHKMALVNDYVSLIDTGIRENRFADDTPMAQVMGSVIPCKDVVTRAKSFPKEN